MAVDRRFPEKRKPRRGTPGFSGSGDRDTEQLELALETLESDQAERLATVSPAVAAAAETASEAQKPARRPLPEHLPREDLRHSAPCTCRSCGSALRKIGEEVTETLDYVPGRFKVIRHLRAKLSCRACDTVVAAPAPDHAIARGRAGAGLLAYIVVCDVGLARGKRLIRETGNRRDM
jgi:transposase